jgi:MoxR-like ATPase
MDVQQREVLYEKWGMNTVIHGGRGAILLMHGPPGTGKTMTATAIAGALGAPLITASFAKLESCYVGETEKNVVQLFAAARKAGAVLFVDEADGLFASRDLAQRSFEIRHVNVLLTELEVFSGVCVLATNNAVVLDHALESRVSLRLEYGLPDAQARAEIWKRHLPRTLPLEDDVDIKKLAVYALSGRDIKQAVLTAARRALRRGGGDGRISHADLAAAAQQRQAADDRILDWTPGRPLRGRHAVMKHAKPNRDQSMQDYRKAFKDILELRRTPHANGCPPCQNALFWVALAPDPELLAAVATSVREHAAAFPQPMFPPCAAAKRCMWHEEVPKSTALAMLRHAPDRSATKLNRGKDCQTIELRPKRDDHPDDWPWICHHKPDGETDCGCVPVCEIVVDMHPRTATMHLTGEVVSEREADSGDLALPYGLWDKRGRACLRWSRARYERAKWEASRAATTPFDAG